jgi:hypothetical protein
MAEHMDVNGLAAVLEAVASILNRQEKNLSPETALAGPVAIRRLADAFEQLEAALNDYRNTLNESIK